MKCLSPIALKGHAGTVFDTHLSLSTYVPCGQCIACRLNYAKFWSIRMMQEMKHHDSACFATLTYDDEHLNDICEDFGQPVLVKSDIQKFWKRLRKERKVRYFCCGEYGDRFGRPHFHAIIYGVSPSETELIEKHWQKGFVKLGTVTSDSCNYVAKYMTKKLRGDALKKKLDEDPNYQNEFVLMSRRPGIGGDLDEDMQKFLQETGFCYYKGRRSGIPRYYKDNYNVQVVSTDPINFDNFINRLTNYDKIDRLVRKGLDFYRKC